MAPSFGKPEEWRRAWDAANPGQQLAPFAPWKPFTPSPAPAGYYDPSLDAQDRAIGRGYRDVLFDAGVGTQRAAEDAAAQRGDVGYQHARGQHQLDIGIARTREDIGTQRTRGTEDYGRSVEALKRAYSRLGTRQAEQQRQFSVAAGGAAAQAARKRAANEAIERQPLDTNFARFGQDLDRASQRSEADYAQGGTWLTEERDRALARVGTAEQRGQEDSTLGVFRAGRERTESGLDIDALRRYQATGAGWVPDEAPSNEFVGPQGPYRVLRQGRQAVGVSPAGLELWRRRR